jgi:hypothetical protein
MGPILMTEDGKKRGAEGAGQPDPLSATGMFLNAFQTQPDQPVEQEDESAGKWFAPEDDGGAALGEAKLGGAKLGGPWGQPLNTLFDGQTIPRRGQACTWRIYADVSQAGICSLCAGKLGAGSPSISGDISPGAG